jgi:endoplasmic reticulum chaperone BiP
MSRLPRRPTRTQSRRMASSLSLLLLAFIALICLCPVSVKADEANGNKKLEYGTVIGIGESPIYPLAKNEPNILL